MKLAVHELESSAITQEIIPSENTNIEAIRPHIYRHNSPAGSLHLEIYDHSDVLVATSETIAISAIGSMSYFHGYIRFYINASLIAGQTYKLKLVGTGGYSFDESAYVGWVNGIDLGKYPINGTPAKSFAYPLDYEVWERTSI